MTNPGPSRLFRRLAVAPRLAARLLAWGAPARSLLFGPLSLGDDLLCTTVLREARQRGQPFVMFSNRPELFLGNRDPVAIRPVDDHYAALLRRMGRVVIQPYYTGPNDPMRRPARHILAEMCRLAGITGEIGLRPWLDLSAEELARAPRLPRQIAIHSTGLSAALPFTTKEWGASNFSALAGLLAGEFSLVQLGAPGDPPLPGVALDLRGRTTLREAAAVVANSLLFVGLEGFLTHLARAVDCPAVVIHGGRTAIGVTDYACNINLHHFPACGPCGLNSDCTHGMACMTAITPTSVAAAVHVLIARPRESLPVETVTL